MNDRRPARHRRWTRHLLGLVIALAGLVAVLVSYNADKGLPFQSIYEFSVDVPNGAELNQGDSVQIGGARAGFVRSIVAVPDGGHPYAQVKVDINGDPHLPVNSTASVQPLSILGEKTLVLERGDSHRQLARGGVLGLSQARPVVDLNAALSTFNPTTRGGIQATISGLAAGVAGRGNDVNTLVSNLAPMLGVLQSVATTLAAPSTDLSGFIDSAADFMSALEPAAPVLPALLANAGSTFDALARSQPALGELIDTLAPAEVATRRTLVAATPALGYLRELAVGLTPASAKLRPALGALNTALSAGTASLAQLTKLATPLRDTAGGLLDSVPPRSEALPESLEELDTTVKAVDGITSVVGPAQEDCNVIGTTLRNGADVIGEGDAQGAWFTFLPLITPFLLPTGSQSSSTHVNYNPTENAQACVAGNEPYLAGPDTTNPPAADETTAHDSTSPPSAATQRAEAAGLLAPPAGARL